MYMKCHPTASLKASFLTSVREHYFKHYFLATGNVECSSVPGPLNLALTWILDELPCV